MTNPDKALFHLMGPAATAAAGGGASGGAAAAGAASGGARGGPAAAGAAGGGATGGASSKCTWTYPSRPLASSTQQSRSHPNNHNNMRSYEETRQ